jgi:hypothetical protein
VSFGQAKPDNKLKLQDLNLTNAPAFSLTDVSPSSIESPTTTKAFSTSIVNSFNQSNGIPQNYAIEFTPFWFTQHPHITNYQYFGIHPDGTNNSFSQARFFALSFAIINKDTATNVGKFGNHNAAFGIRTTLIRVMGYTARKKIVGFAAGWDNLLKAQLDSLNGLPPTVAQLDALRGKIKYADSIKKYMTQVPVFSLDIAAASNLNFPNNSFSSNHLSRAGVWVNANLALDLKDHKESSSSCIKFSGIARYIYASDSLTIKKNYVSTNFIDIGLKTEMQLGNISLAYEYINRSSSNQSITGSYKSVGLLHYKIKDGVFLTGAFGQNFASSNNLITSLGINWGISNGKENIEQ